MFAQDQKIKGIQHPSQDTMTPLRSLSVYHTTQPDGSLKMFWLMPMRNVPQWEKEEIHLEQAVSLEK